MLIDGTGETLTGHAGELYVATWPNPDARHLVVVAHGYGEHSGRYAHVGAALVANGAAVAAPDLAGHGRSEGVRDRIDDLEPLVDDLHLVVQLQRDQHVGLPVVLLGAGLGGLIAARYAQRHGGAINALVLAGPVLGTWAPLALLRRRAPLPERTIDARQLTADPTAARSYTADPLVWRGPLARETLTAVSTALQQVRSAQRIPGLPCLWLHGGRDPLVAPGQARSAVRALLADTEPVEVVLPDSRHSVLDDLDRRDALEELGGFLGRVTGQRQ